MLEFDHKTHTYTWGGRVLPSVTQTLQGVGLIDFTGISPDVLQRAADFGKAVHLATAFDDAGDLDYEALALEDNPIKPYVDAWRSYKLREGIKFDAIEQPLCHSVWNFAGTPDRICRTIKDNSEYPTIIDIKTSTTVPAWVAIQTAGYAILADLPTARRIAVQLKPDGTYQIHEFKDRQDRGVFLSCLAVFNWRRNHATT